MKRTHQKTNKTFHRKHRPLSLPLRCALLGIPVAGSAQAAGSESADVVLPALQVEAQSERETAWGPVQGYVAEHSATGTKTDTPLIETPQSISVITRDRIDAQNANTLSETLRYTPGVQSESFGFQPRSTSIFIRGFDAASTGLFRDGLQLRNSSFDGAFNPEPYGLERVDVLRGPASILFGQGSPGGLVNMVTKRPTATPFGEVRFEPGNYDRLQGKFDLGGPIDDAGVFSYRLTGLGRGSGTQVEHIDDDRLFIAPAFTWRPDENTSLTFLSQFQKDDFGDFQFIPPEGSLLPNPNGKISRSLFTGEPDFDNLERIQYSVGYLFEHRTEGPWTFRQNFRHTHSELDRRVVYSGSLRPDLRTLDRYAFGADGELDSVSVDNQAEVRFAIGPLGHTVLVGVDYQRIDISDVRSFGDAPPLDVFAPVYGAAVADPAVYKNEGIAQEQIGLYFQDQVKLYDQWTLQFGGRHDWVSNDTKNRLGGTRTIQDDEAFTGRAGLVYVSDIGLAPYASYSESFVPTTGTDASGRPLKPETGQQYEVGVKYQPQGWKSFITLAFFDLTRQNYLQFVPPSFESRQTGEIHSRGVELEGVARLDLGLDLIASYTYLDAEIAKSDVPGEKGERPTQVPEHMASLWGDYTVRGGALKGFGVGAGVRYNGSTYGNAPNTLKVPSYVVGDAAVHYQWDKWRLAVNLQNVFDKEYVAAAYEGPYTSFGAARTVIGSIGYRW
jgi:iron complex outermembrane receptor protein